MPTIPNAWSLPLLSIIRMTTKLTPRGGYPWSLSLFSFCLLACLADVVCGIALLMCLAGDPISSSPLPYLSLTCDCPFFSLSLVLVALSLRPIANGRDRSLSRRGSTAASSRHPSCATTRRPTWSSSTMGLTSRRLGPFWRPRRGRTTATLSTCRCRSTRCPPPCLIVVIVVVIVIGKITVVSVYTFM